MKIYEVAGEDTSHGDKSHGERRYQSTLLKSLDGYINIIMICSFLWADLFFTRIGTNGERMGANEVGCYRLREC